MLMNTVTASHSYGRDALHPRGFMTKSHLHVLFAPLALSALFACSSGPEVVTEDYPPRARYANLEDDSADKEYDLNGDGKGDQWRYSGPLTRTERDLNFDGIIDVYEYSNSAGEIVETEMDLDLDGKVDLVNHYSAGKLVKKELSVDFNSFISITKYYDNEGALSRIELDNSGDGKVDTWEYYENNSLVRTGRDVNSDGQPDIFEDAGS